MFALIKLPIYAISEFSGNLLECGINGNGTYTLQLLRMQGRIQVFFRRGCTRLLLYFDTNKPHSFLFLQNTSCIRKPQVISGEGGGVRTPSTLPLDPPLECIKLTAKTVDEDPASCKRWISREEIKSAKI